LKLAILFGILFLGLGIAVMVSERAAAQSEVGGRVYYYHNDHLMTPVFMTDSSGWAVWTLAQGPFDDYLVNTDHDGDKIRVYNPFRFPAQ